MEADSGQSAPSGGKKRKKEREENLVAKIIRKIKRQNEIEDIDIYIFYDTSNRSHKKKKRKL